jgi:hypothetical protein
VAFPHPQSRKDHDWNKDIARLEGIGWQFVEWTVNVAEDWNTEEEVNAAQNRPAQASACGVG